jgi:hypothetical protein
MAGLELNANVSLKKLRIGKRWRIHSQCIRRQPTRSPTVIRSSSCQTLAVRRRPRSLFLPVIEIQQMFENAGAAALFGILGQRLAVFFQNHPDIGQITGRRVRI